jgi:hypothetical protein
MDSRTALLNTTPGRRRVAAILLPVLLAAVVGALGLGVHATLRARADTVTERREQLGRLQMILAASPAAGGEETGASAAGAGREFLSGGSDALIQAAFQARFNEIASASGVEVLAVGNTPIELRNGARFAGLRASMSGTNDAIVEAIFAIETSEPYLTIRTARINGYGESASQAADGPQELLLQLQFDGALPPESDAADPAGEIE